MAAPTFNDWNSVSQYYGQNVANMLQQNNVPLNQVGQTVQNVGGSFTGGGGYQGGGSDPGYSGWGVAPGGSGGGQSNLAQALGQYFGSSSNQQPQQPNFNPTNNPQYMYSQLGAAATNQPMVVNPNPSQQPINAKGGVYSGQQTPYVGSTVPTAPQGPWNQVPGLLGGQAPTVAPSSSPPVTGSGGTPYPGGAQYHQGRAFASVPPPSAPSGPVGGAAIKLPAPPFMYSSGAPTGSTGSIALAAANPPKQMATGGQVGKDDTDTVPAMLTPGEYVINRQAAQQIGKDELDKLNKAGKKKKSLGAGLDWLGGLGEPTHMQGGGEVPDVTGTAQNWAYQQLSPEEQQLLIQSQSGGTGGTVNPQVAALQKKLAGYVTQYIDANPASGSQAPPNANTVAQGMFNAGYKPGPVPQGQPQNAAMQVGPPTPSTAQTPAPPAPGESNMPTSQQLTNLSNSPQGQWANMTPTQKGEMGVASGISNIGQAWANAEQNIAQENWKPIAPGSWSNPSQYQNSEYSYYQRYHDQMQQLMI